MGDDLAERIAFADADALLTQTYLSLTGRTWRSRAHSGYRLKHSLEQWCSKNLEHVAEVWWIAMVSETMTYRGLQGAFSYRYPVITFGSKLDAAKFLIVNAHLATQRECRTLHEMWDAEIITAFPNFEPHSNRKG